MNTSVKAMAVCTALEGFTPACVLLWFYTNFFKRITYNGYSSLKINAVQKL